MSSIRHPSQELRTRTQDKHIRSKFQNLKYLTFFLLFAILFLGAFLRFYKIREYITFLGDEGRDVLVVKRMIVDHKFTLLGPTTSVGAMYMGPIYYYFMIPFLWVWNFDPVGPAVMVVLFALLTIFLIFRIGSEFFDRSVGLTAAFLYAISPLTITYGKSSWNPNVVPFFATILIYGLHKMIVKKEFRWFFVVGMSLGILIQLHYVTLLFLPVILLSLAMIHFRIPLRNYLTACAAFILSYSPFLLFELRHQFVNTQSLVRFISQQKGDQTKSLIVEVVNTVTDVFVRIFWRLIVIENAELTKLFILILITGIYLYARSIGSDLKKYLSLKLLLLWGGIGILSFGLYRGTIYDYYFGSLFPVPFLLTGILLSYLWKFPAGKIFASVILFTLVIFNLKSNPLRIPPSNLLKNTETIARFVNEKASGKPYNFALIADKNSDHAYRYFLELWGNAPIVVEAPQNDPERKTVMPQLFIVCEEKICKPLGHPLWEIAGFGQAEIADEWQVVTVKVFRLIQYRLASG